MIFVSYTRADKELVEQVALRLAAAFGQNNVFYDSWSIQPGEGIIDRMSEGLADTTHFFFFVTANSLQSKMVSLEWQNALLKATHGKCRFVAVRCDASELPPIMAQSLFIDLYSVGLDAAVAQIADVVRGQSTYRAPSQPFSNLVFSVTGAPSDLTVEIKPKFYLEPIASFVLLIENDQREFEVKAIDEDPVKSGFNANVPLDNGEKVNGYLVGLFRGLTPAMPLRVHIRATGTKPIVLRGVLHQESHNQWRGVPPEVTPLAVWTFGRAGVPAK